MEEGMLYYLIKLLITSVLVVAVSEVARRSTLVGAILASIPLVSVLALFWLYYETRSTAAVARLAGNIFWMVLPSLCLFLLLPLLLRSGWTFAAAMAAALSATVLTYLVAIWLCRVLGLSL